MKTFNVVSNIRNREIVADISLSELAETIKNPSAPQKKIIETARKYGKLSKRYDKIKKSLPCLVPNFVHMDYVEGDSVIDSTGFLYIDIDENIEMDFSQFPFVALAWKSLSNKGYGVLVSVENLVCDLKVLKDVVGVVSNMMGVNPDYAAVSRDRLNVISYDENVYFNPAYTTLNVDDLVDHDPDPNGNKTSKNTVSDTTLDEGGENPVDTARYNGIHNSSEDEKNMHPPSLKTMSLIGTMSGAQNVGNLTMKQVRLTNLPDILNRFEFEEGQRFIDLGKENKIGYTDIFIPFNIPNGSRNKRLFSLLTGVKGINPEVSRQQLMQFGKVLNTRCDSPLSERELQILITKVDKAKIKPYANKTRRFIYNPEYTITRGERLAIINRAKGEVTKDTIRMAIRNWDFEKYRKITYKNICEVTGLSMRTCNNHSDLIKEERNALMVA